MKKLHFAIETSVVFNSRCCSFISFVIRCGMVLSASAKLF